MEFELQINESQVVMLDLSTMLDALWFAQEMDLVAPQPTTWWDDAGEHKERPELDRSPSGLLDLEELDTFYF